MEQDQYSDQRESGFDTLTIHISEKLRIRTTIDILDNVVVGNPIRSAYPTSGSGVDLLSRSDASIAAFSDRQRHETGVNSWRDSVRVKRVWGEWKTELGLIAASQMPTIGAL